MDVNLRISTTILVMALSLVLLYMQYKEGISWFDMQVTSVPALISFVLSVIFSIFITALTSSAKEVMLQPFRFLPDLYERF